MRSPPAAPAGGVPEAERRRGYQRWTGERTAQGWRWWVIARGNLSLSLSNRWVKAMLVASLIPGVIFAGITYLALPLSAIALKGVLDVSLLFTFIVAALVGARLVSEDRRQGAFLAHFSRPVTRLDYVAGKLVALAIPLLFVSTAPALLTISADASIDDSEWAERVEQVGEFFGGDNNYFVQTSYAGAVGAVLAFGLLTSLATAGIVLGLSALSTRARIAGVMWFAVVAFGSAAKEILQEALPREPEWPALLSWFDNLSDAGGFLLGLTTDPRLDLQLEFGDQGYWLRILVLGVPAALGLWIVHEQLRRAEGGVR